MKNKILSGLLCMAMLCSQAQNREAERVDSLFARCTPEKPGYIVGIIKEGQLVYAKGFGSANLEDRTLLSPQSRFYMGSTSKQFTAACILMLAEKGKLQLGDDVRKYLPELPEYGRKITIENLLHHTGGIREYTSLMLVSGFNAGFEDFFDNAYVYRLLCRQKSLNFLPGEAHQYSNGGYIMLATIVERVTGRSLRQFADSVLFRPLGMDHSFFSDYHDEVIPGRVQCYRPVKDGYAGFVKNFETYGDGGLFTTVEDLAKWDGAYYSDKLGIPHFAQKMEQTTTLNDGYPIKYAMGLNIGVYKGLKTVEHGGFMLAYDSEIMRFPDQHFTVIVLSNSYNTWSTTLAYQVADIWLADQFAAKKAVAAPGGLASTPAKQHTAPRKLTASGEQGFAGHYWNIHENYYVLINAKQDSLHRGPDSLFYDNTFGYKETLIPLGKDSFLFAGSSGMKLAFSDSTMRLIDESSNTPVQEFVRYDATQPTLQEVVRYAGRYYSEELRTTYTITLEKGPLLPGDSSLQLTINNNPKMQLYPVKDRAVWNSKTMVWIGFAEIHFEQDRTGTVTGFTIGDGRLRGILFKRIN